MSLRATLAAFAALGLFALASAANAQTTAYVDKNLFLANVAPGSYLQNFDTLVVGTYFSNPKAFGGNGFQYDIGALLGISVVSGNGGGAALSPFDVADDLQIASTGNPITAIGGNFYNTDSNGGYLSGNLLFTLSNGASFSLPLATATGFIGFTVTSGSITSLNITGDSGGAQYATVDNLIVGSYAAAVTTTPVSGRIALESVTNLAAVSVYSPLGTFHISFRKPGTMVEIYGFDVTLTVSANSPFGKYSVSVPPGTYDVLTKGAKNLAVKSSGVVVGSASGTIPAVTLPAGDANNDNSVDSTDFGLLIGAFNTTGKVTGSGYDPAADFNFDGSIDSSDFGLLIGEFNVVGAK